MTVALIAAGATREQREADREQVREADTVEHVEGDRPEQTDIRARRLRRRRRPQAQHAADREQRADDHLAELVGLAEALAVPAVEQSDDREEGDADHGVERDEPGGRQLGAEEVQVELRIAPHQIDVEDLVVRHDRDREHGDQQKQRGDREPVASVHRGGGRRIGGAGGLVLVREVFLSGEIDDEPDQHADPAAPKPQCQPTVSPNVPTISGAAITPALMPR